MTGIKSAYKLNNILTICLKINLKFDKILCKLFARGFHNMGFLTSLSNTIQTGWASIIRPVASGADMIAASVLENPIPIAVALGATFALTAIANPQNRISRTIQKGIDACRSQWNKAMNSTKQLLSRNHLENREVGKAHEYFQASKVQIKDEAIEGRPPLQPQANLVERKHQDNIVPMTQPFEEKETPEQTYSQLLQWAKQTENFNAYNIDRHTAFKLLPPKLQTQENFNALVELTYENFALEVAKAFQLLPPKIQTQESFNALVKFTFSYSALDVANAFQLLPPKLQTQESFEALIVAGNSKRVAEAIWSLTPELQNQKMLAVLIKAGYWAVKVAQAITILPENLQTDETFGKLFEMEENAVEAAFILIAGEGVNDDPHPLLVDDAVKLADESCHLSKCLGRRLALDGIGHIYEFRTRDDIVNIEKIQETLLPAPEGPFGLISILPPFRLFSKGMQQFACIILQEDPNPNESLFEICERAKMQLVEQLKGFDQLQQNNTAEAIAVKSLLSTFEASYCKLKLSSLGYSYTEENGRWTVPDVAALRHRLKLQGARFEIEEVNGIITDEEFLYKVLNCDVVIGDYAHDHWIHAYSQLSKFYTDSDRYIQEREKDRSLIRSALDGLNLYLKNGAEDELLPKVFRTVLGMYLDVATASGDFGADLPFRWLYMSEVFESMLVKLYPEHMRRRESKVAFWYEQFLPFAEKLVGTYVKDEEMKKILLDKLQVD